MGKICTFCKHKRVENRCALISSNASVEKTERCCYYEPVEEIAPVVHAHWIEDGDDDICSNCNEIVFPLISGLQMDKRLKEGKTYWNYCPHCGAIMDEKEEG